MYYTSSLHALGCNLIQLSQRLDMKSFCSGFPGENRFQLNVELYQYWLKIYSEIHDLATLGEIDSQLSITDEFNKNIRASNLTETDLISENYLDAKLRSTSLTRGSFSKSELLANNVENTPASAKLSKNAFGQDVFESESEKTQSLIQDIKPRKIASVAKISSVLENHADVVTNKTNASELSAPGFHESKGDDSEVSIAQFGGVSESTSQYSSIAVSTSESSKTALRSQLQLNKSKNNSRDATHDPISAQRPVTQPKHNAQFEPNDQPIGVLPVDFEQSRATPIRTKNTIHSFEQLSTAFQNSLEGQGIKVHSETQETPQTKAVFESEPFTKLREIRFQTSYSDTFGSNIKHVLKRFYGV